MPVKHSAMRNRTLLYTDGACSVHTDQMGGWAFKVVSSDATVFRNHGSVPNSTNSRMELLAVINGLLAIKQPSNVLVRSDSLYVVNAFNQKWIKDWEHKQWHRKGKLIPNYDLWQRLLHAMECHLSVAFEWTDETDPYLKAVDELAKGAT